MTRWRIPLHLQDIRIEKMIRRLGDLVKMPAHIFAHVAIIVVSASIALTLPATTAFLAQQFLAFWALIGSEKVFLLVIEIAFAVILILLFNYVLSVWRDRSLARAARAAGLVHRTAPGRILSEWRSRRMKSFEGIARDIMIIGVTGRRTFGDDTTELGRAMPLCRKSEIMLLNPSSEGAAAQARAMLHPDITPGRFKRELQESIAYLQKLRDGGKDIRLKLYSDMPLVKLIVAGDLLWFRHYHPGLPAQELPEYLFLNTRQPGGIYVFLYQYFMRKWNDPAVPEYDFETGELVYRDEIGVEEHRAPLQEPEFAMTM